MFAVAELQQLPLHEKLLAMEALWEGIARAETELEVPEWHKTILDERQCLVAEGKAHFIDWETAKKQLRDGIS
jgi:hypothetical protein